MKFERWREPGLAVDDSQSPEPVSLSGRLAQAVHITIIIIIGLNCIFQNEYENLNTQLANTSKVQLKLILRTKIIPDKRSMT